MTLPLTMQAAVVTAYGGPEMVRIQSRPVPPLGGDTVLVALRAATVSSGDARLRALDAPPGLKTLMRLMTGLFRPRRPVFGTEGAGIVLAAGPEVTRFRPGESVIAFSGLAMGCHAQYLALPQTAPIVRKPAGLDFAEAASLAFGGTTALYFLKKADIRAGEHILVIGASGAVGTAMVQLARHFGATVTALTSARNAELAKSLGADAVLDYAVTDFTRASVAYDIVADTVGASSFKAARDALKPGGRYLAVAGGLGDMLARPRDGRRVIAGIAPERLDDLAFLVDLAARGAYRAVIDRVYPLGRIAEAHAYVSTKRKRGSVVIEMRETPGEEAEASSPDLPLSP